MPFKDVPCAGNFFLTCPVDKGIPVSATKMWPPLILASSVLYILLQSGPALLLIRGRLLAVLDKHLGSAGAVQTVLLPLVRGGGEKVAKFFFRMAYTSSPSLISILLPLGYWMLASWSLAEVWGLTRRRMRVVTYSNHMGSYHLLTACCSWLGKLEGDVWDQWASGGMAGKPQ